MTNQKLIRRTLLATAMTISAANATTVLGFQQGQYQPGQPGAQIPQGNTSVTQELNRMFQESGQQMPSMNPQELPNGNTPTQGQIRLRQTENQNQTNSNNAQQATSEKNPGLLTRFFGKFRGGSNSGAAANNPDFRPPVPPGYTNAAPSTATSAAGNVRSQGQQPVQQQNQQVQNVPRPSAAQANHAGKPSAAPSAPNSGQDPKHFKNGAMSQIPPRSGATVQAISPTRPVSSSPPVTENRATYTQPGSAPGFMSTAGASTVIQQRPAESPAPLDKFQDEFIQDNTGGSVRARTVPKQAKPPVPASVAAKDAVNGFENPFLDSGDSTGASEALDLDSLIEIPRATLEPVKAQVRQTTPAAPVAAALIELENPPEQKTAAAPELQEPAATASETFVNEAVETLDDNPFTGVQLEVSDATVFDGQGRADAAENTSFGVPVAPMEDFNPDLPAIGLPPVDDAELNDDSQPGELSTSEFSPAAGDDAAAFPASEAARAELQPSPDVPATMNAADTERLRQTAEQQRRQRQQRQILVRAGQTGFKGFCPVALRERRELIESSPQFSSTFGLQTYTFSSAEAKIAFDTDPSRYAPAAGGSDVVVLVNSGEEQSGQLDYALWYRDRLYLFRARETMTLFSKDPQRFASQY